MDDDDWLAQNLEWSDRQERLFYNMAHETDALEDRMLQQVFNLGWFDPDVGHEERMASREWVEQYVFDTYGYVFDEYFDWETWREMYGDLA